MRLLLAVSAALLVLSVATPPSVQPQRPANPDIYTFCVVRAKPGNAFTFVPPPPVPAPAATAGGRAQANLTAATITVDYVGFGAFPAAQAAFQYAVDIWETLISSPQTIRVQATFTDLGGGGVLGSAGSHLAYPNFPGAPVANAYYGDPLADAVGGTDRNPPPGSPAPDYDILASFNSSFANWYFGTDGNPPGGQSDFVSVVLHELGHGLEFSGQAFVNTGTGVGEIRFGLPTPFPGVYDVFTEDHSGNPMLGFTDPSTALGTALQQDYNAGNPRGPGVYWGGPLGVAANGAQTARLYTPDPWEGGSSYSHLDEDVYVAGDPNSLMTPSIQSAEAIHNPGPITLGMFADMGWNNFISNGTFSFGTAGWTTFGDITFAVNNGVFEYYQPLDGTPSAAVVFQNTGEPVPTDTGLFAQFTIGNSSTVRKRMSVLMHDQDFSDLSVCTFWLEASTPPATYRMYSHTTEAWVGASLSFYAATHSQNGGFYQLDDVSYHSTAGLLSTRTDCVDPTAPASPGGSDGPNLITNGDFATGFLTPWSVFGTLTWQIAGNVFEYIRPTATPPAGVVLQATGTAMTADEVITASFDLGNSSSVRKRVTVLLHDLNFSDLTACTFWLAPSGSSLSTYQIRAYTPAAWANATLSIYAATIDVNPWIRIDNAVLQRTPGDTPLGTECFEPGDPGPL